MQVAEFLLRGRTGQPIDLSDTLVLLPTAGAGRAIRRELARTGVLSPEFRLPMDALLPRKVPVASRLEREAAWAILLNPAARRGFSALLPEMVPLDGPEDRFGVAGRLCAVCDQLAEAGLDPSSPKLATDLVEEAPRWRAFKHLHADYLHLLSKHGLRDPNDLRIAQAQEPTLMEGCRRVVVACVPDLPPVVESQLRAWQRLGIMVEILAWSPSGQEAHLDAWGRPDPRWWRDHPPQVSETSIIAANEPPTEAGLLLDFAAGVENADFELFAAAPESAAALAQEIGWRDGEPYLPEGHALGQTESAGILLGWSEFARSHRLRDLRVLLQKPRFLSFLVAEAADPGRFGSVQALEACDRLISGCFCEDLEAARSWLQHAAKAENKRGHADFLAQKVLIHTATRLLEAGRNSHEILAGVTKADGPVAMNSRAAKELAAMAEVAAQFVDSPILGSLDQPMREAASKADILRKRLFPGAPAGAVEVQGWLEAPWSTARTLIIAGCREGALPAGTSDDSFLPDGAKGRLGLPTQDGRLARDAYLLSCLLAAHPASAVRLGFSRLGPQAEPNRPSRLLFGCDDRNLPRRCQQLFKPSPRAERRDRQETAFRLHLPKPAQWPPASLRVTAFKSYLDCPLRFYLGTILNLRKIDPDAREIPSTDFGIVMHKVLERFALDESLRSLRDAGDIARELSNLLDEVAPIYYGRRPSPVVRVQLENMRTRLTAAAVTEAAIRDEGWSTLAAEHQVLREEQRLLGGLALTGTLDRIDSHPDHGLRILDYKTYSTPKTPQETHLGPRRPRPYLPEADVEVANSKGKMLARSWTDLQLPLYVWLARQIWPEQAARGIAVGYFLLPPDGQGAEKTLKIFELTEDLQASAERCAARIADLVRGGHFWPPSPSTEVAFDDFQDWFPQGDPRDLIDEESAHRLNGNP